MKPMLAAAVTDLSIIRYPVLVSPKYDGIRAIVLKGVALSRSLKPIPSVWVQQLFGRPEYNGFDGELIVGKATDKDCFNTTSSGVMSKSGTPNVRYYVFDDILGLPGDLFRNRLACVESRIKSLANAKVVLIPHQLVKNQSELDQQEIWALQDGYEGIMIRDPHGPYKFGRSTLKEGYLLKLKRFEDSEAEIIGMTELMHNANEIETNELGQKERSSKKAGMKGKGTMGSLIVKDLKTGVQFEIGTGFTAEQRAWFWAGGFGRPVVKYKYQPTGVKDKPRFPVYLGLRDRIDLS